MVFEAVTRLKRLVAGPSQWKLGFDPRSVHMTMVVDKAARDRFFSEYFGFTLLIVIQPLLHIFIYMLLLSGGQTGEAWELWIESDFMYVCPCIIYEIDERYPLDATILLL